MLTALLVQHANLAQGNGHFTGTLDCQSYSKHSQDSDLCRHSQNTRFQLKPAGSDTKLCCAPPHAACLVPVCAAAKEQAPAPPPVQLWSFPHMHIHWVPHRAGCTCGTEHGRRCHPPLTQWRHTQHRDTQHKGHCTLVLPARPITKLSKRGQHTRRDTTHSRHHNQQTLTADPLAPSSVPPGVAKPHQDAALPAAAAA
jgi:hypothetical protein